MSYRECQNKWKNFCTLIEQQLNVNDEQLTTMIKNHIEQHIIVLNEFFSISIDNLKKLQEVQSVSDIICAQTKFSNDISQKITASTQHLLNTALGDIADYNEWLKLHYEATD